MCLISPNEDPESGQFCFRLIHMSADRNGAAVPGRTRNQYETPFPSPALVPVTLELPEVQPATVNAARVVTPRPALTRVLWSSERAPFNSSPAAKHTQSLELRLRNHGLTHIRLEKPVITEPRAHHRCWWIHSHQHQRKPRKPLHLFAHSR